MNIHHPAERQRAEAPVGSYPNAPGAIPARQVPIFINSFNRVTALTRLVTWLLDAGQRRIVIIDNASTYPPLLTFLDRIEKHAAVEIVRLGANFGHRALWERGILDRLGIDTEYVYTDPDIVPDRACPRDLVARLQRLLRDEPLVKRVGLGLRVDGIPDCYAHKARALAWERHFWNRPAAPGWFLADIDTTFAMYRPGAQHRLGELVLRTGWPYLATHEGWAVNTASPDQEYAFYMGSARRESSSWALPDLAPDIAAAMSSDTTPAPRLLRLRTRRRGPGEPAWHGYVEHRPGPLDIADGSIDGIHADTAFPSLRGNAFAWSELRRVSRRGARMVLRVALAALPALRGEGGAGRLLDRVLGRRTLPIPLDWRLERLLLLGTPTTEAVVHLVACVANESSAAPPVIPEHVPGRLDLTVDFNSPVRAGR